MQGNVAADRLHKEGTAYKYESSNLESTVCFDESVTGF